MNRSALSLSVLGVVALAGCGSSGTPYSPAPFDGTVTATPTPAPSASPTPTPAGGSLIVPDFNLSNAKDNSYQSIGTFDSNGDVTLQIVVRGTTALTGPVVLSVKDASPGVTASFSPANFTATDAGVPVSVKVHTPTAATTAELTFQGKSSGIQRTMSAFLSPGLQPFEILVLPNDGQPVSSRTRSYAVAVKQNKGSGVMNLSLLRSDTSAGTGLLPLPAGATVTGLPSSVTFAEGELGKNPFNIQVTLPDDAPSGNYGFAIAATRDGVQFKSATQLQFVASGGG